MMAERCRAARGGVRRDDSSIGTELLDYYGRLVNRSSGPYERAARAYRNFSTENFDQTKTKVNAAIVRALGERLAGAYLVVRLATIEGGRIFRFGLAISPDAITITPASLPA